MLFGLITFHMLLVIYTRPCEGKQPEVEKDYVCKNISYDKLDLFIVLDGSSSISLVNFQKMLNFIRQIIENLKVGSEDTRVGLLQYNQFYRLEFKLDRFFAKKKLSEAVGKVQYLEGATSTGRAIRFVVEKQFVEANGARKDVPDVIVVVTDGYSQDDVTLPSKLARSRGIEMIAVGISDWVNNAQLFEIANGDLQRIFLLEDFDSLHKILASLLSQIKRAVNKKCYDVDFATSSLPLQSTTVSLASSSTSSSSESSTPIAQTSTLTTTTKRSTAKPIVTTISSVNSTQSPPAEQVLVKCEEGRMQILSDLLKNRQGWMYVKGHFDDPVCRWSLTELTTNNSSPLLKFNQCGMQRNRMANPKGLAFSTTVISMRHPQFLTKGDRAFKLQCFYMEAEKSVTNNLEIVMLPTEFISKPAPMPSCRYSLRSVTLNGPAMRTSAIGSKVFHRWDCETDGDSVDIYGMKIHSCYVRNHLGTKRALIIDEEGCVTDKYLLSNLNYSAGLLTAYSEGSVFAFADSDDLSFDCQIALCFKQSEPSCQEITPPKCIHSEKVKRSATGSFSKNYQQSIDISSESILIFDPLGNDEENFDKPLEKGESFVKHMAMNTTKPLQYCLTWPTLIAAVLSIGALLLYFLLLFTHLLRKNTSRHKLTV